MLTSFLFQSQTRVKSKKERQAEDVENQKTSIAQLESKVSGKKKQVEKKINLERKENLSSSRISCTWL
jgi:hypothetical protein